MWSRDLAEEVDGVGVEADGPRAAGLGEVVEDDLAASVVDGGLNAHGGTVEVDSPPPQAAQLTPSHAGGRTQLARDAELELVAQGLVDELQQVLQVGWHDLAGDHGAPGFVDFEHRVVADREAVAAGPLAHAVQQGLGLVERALAQPGSAHRAEEPVQVIGADLRCPFRAELWLDPHLHDAPVAHKRGVLTALVVLEMVEVAREQLTEGQLPARPTRQPRTRADLGDERGQSLGGFSRGAVERAEHALRLA